MLDSSRDALVVQDWQQPASLNILDLELLHNFCTSTCYTLNSDPILKTLWRINVPQLGFEYDFVLRGILSLSALHLARFRPDRRDWYISQAMLQSHAGLARAAPMLSNITEENCSAMYLFSILTFILKLASPRKPGDLLVMGDSGLQEWMVFFHGMRVIVKSSHDTLKKGVLSPMFAAGKRRSQLWEKYGSERPAAMEHLEILRGLIRRHIREPDLLQVYMEAMSELQKPFALAYCGVFQTLETSDVFIFLFRVSEEYLLLLKEPTQEALAIFAYFCAVAKLLEGKWWSEGLSCHLISEVYPLLDEDHKLWVQWAIEEIGWLPTRET